MAMCRVDRRRGCRCRDRDISQDGNGHSREYHGRQGFLVQCDNPLNSAGLAARTAQAPSERLFMWSSWLVGFGYLRAEPASGFPLNSHLPCLVTWLYGNSSQPML